VVLGIVLAVLLVLALLAASYVGVRLVWAGRQLDDAGLGDRIPVAPHGSVAAKVDARLQRARVAVEGLVMVDEVPGDDLAPSPSALRERAQTYSVLGVGLLCLAGAVVFGALLLI
jgi:hypothetical protein